MRSPSFEALPKDVKGRDHGVLYTQAPLPVASLPRPGSTQAGVEIQRVSQRPVQLVNLDAGQGRHVTDELALEHQREEVAMDRRNPGQTLVRPDDYLGGKAQDPAVDRCADDRRNVVVLDDEDEGA